MPSSLHDIPGEHQVQAHVTQINSSATTNYVAIVSVPFKCLITGIDYGCSDDVTGADTNTVHFNVDNAAGTEIANLDLVSGTDLTEGVDQALTLTSTTADLQLAEGDTLRVEAEEVGTGLGAAIAEGHIVVKFTAR